eukprot:TRINITY_DN18152_c0_g1_i1.p1 TRINITY_DN18152_c0_g1~~TRINITY_DN18152_c0_g1_i1.p1  ORF type:complete len:357 (+),score=89.79 TRINITY_DN18152_c0_g1_i1:48-1073(+)
MEIAEGEDIESLGKGTFGLGGDSDKAIREYQRQSQRAWRRSKLSQKREKLIEEERLFALVKNAAAERKKEYEDEQIRKQIQAEKQLVKRKEQEKAMAEMMEKRREDWRDTLVRERTGQKLRAEKAQEQRKEKREREVENRKLKMEKDRSEWRREIELHTQQRVQEVTEMKRQSELSRERKHLAVERAKQDKLAHVKNGKSEQLRKERVKKKIVEGNRFLLHSHIRESTDNKKKRRILAEENKTEKLHSQMEARKKEHESLNTVMRERREAKFLLIKEQHNRELHREQMKRKREMTQKNYFHSSLFRGDRYAQSPVTHHQTRFESHTMPTRPLSAPPGRGDL